MWTAPMHASATTIYPTKDDRWFQLHGDLDCRPLLEDINILDQEVSSREEAREIFTRWTMQYTADELESMMVKLKHSGSKCYHPGEWLETKMVYIVFV